MERERARGSVGYLSKTAVYKTWSMQSCLQRSTGRGPRSQKVECYTFATRNILYWDGQWCELLQFEMVRMRSEKQKIQLTPWEPSSISFIHWVPGFSVTLFLLKLRSATCFSDLINIKMMQQPTHSNVSVLCLLLLLSSFLGCPQSCWWLFWHFRWCSQSPHFSSGHKSLKLNCCTVSKKQQLRTSWLVSGRHVTQKCQQSLPLLHQWRVSSSPWWGGVKGNRLGTAFWWWWG